MPGLMISLINAYRRTAIIIDALDEADPKKRRKSLDTLKAIMETSSSLVKIFVSSRDDGDIVRTLKGVPNLFIEAKDNSQDIEWFVQREITQCIMEGRLLEGVVSDETKIQVMSCLVDKVNGMQVYFEYQVRNTLENYPRL
jgi:hypothetical protein